MAGKYASELGIAMFGESLQDKTTLANLISRRNFSKPDVNPTKSKPPQFVKGTWKQTPFIIYKTRNEVSINRMKHEIRQCVFNCPPGPNALLLLINPNSFTELDSDKLISTLGFFDKDAFAFSMVVTTQDSTRLNPFVQDIIRKCDKRHQRIVLDRKTYPGHDIEEMMQKTEDLVNQNRGQHLSLSGTYEPQLPLHEEMENVYMNPSGERRVKRSMSSVEERVQLFERRSNMADLRNQQHKRTESTPVTLSKKKQSLLNNINDQRKVPEQLKMVEDTSRNTSFTAELFPKPVVKPIPRERNKTSRSSKPVRSSEPLRVVMVGKTGCGKSATGNTILGREEFSSITSAKSVTRLCSKAEGSVADRPIEIVDTPGLFDTTLSNTEVQQELVKCISLLAPGPHAFLMVLQIGRFTKEERETVELIKHLFGEESQRFILVLLTKGDELRDTTIESYIEGTDVQTVINECGGRYQVFNNYSDNRKQVTELIHKIDSMVTLNKGTHYTSEMFIEAEQAIEKETAKILREKEPKVPRQQVMQKIIQTFEDNIHKQAKQLRETDDKCKREQERRRQEQEEREQEEEMRKLEEDLQRKRFKIKQDTLQRQMESEQEDLVLPKTMVMSIAMEELKKERASWERERREWWERRHEEDRQLRFEEQELYENFQREYEEERLKYEDERQRYEDERLTYEAQLRHQKEREYQEEKHYVKQKAEARRQAAESNEFLTKYTLDLEEELQRRETENERLYGATLQNIIKDKKQNEDFKSLKKGHDHQIKALLWKYKGNDKDPQLQREMEQLQDQHGLDIKVWIRDRVDKSVKRKHCTIQ